MSGNIHPALFNKSEECEKCISSAVVFRLFTISSIKTRPQIGGLRDKSFFIQTHKCHN